MKSLFAALQSFTICRIPLNRDSLILATTSALGLDIVTHKRDNGIHGCPVPLGQNEEPSYVEKAKKIRH